LASPTRAAGSSPADDIRYLRITAEEIASNKPLTPQERSVLSKTLLALLDRAEPIE
jgi:hypothetical protein